MTGDLTSKDKVKQYLQIEGSSDDALLDRLVSSASVFVATFLNRNILSASYSEKYAGMGGSILVLRQTPVTAVTSLTINGVTVPPSDGSSIGYQFDDLSIILIGRVFSRGINNVAVQYTAGYASVPLDVEAAVIEFVALEYRERSRVGKKSDAQPQGGTTTYLAEAMNARTKAILQNYQRKIPI